MVRFSPVALVAVVMTATTSIVNVNAFSVVVPATSSSISRVPGITTTTTTSRSINPVLFAEQSTSSSSGAFIDKVDNDDDNKNYDDDDEDDEDTLEKIELMGKGAAKVKRGKRKGTSASSSTPKVKLAPEEVFYEGPPAITETIVPTVSILTVVGIIPAAAAWARQAWVRYKITSRRIRVQSGVGGKEMAEIVYPDVIEIRTVKRLFGDGDMVLYLRDGAKFEMRNIPNFDATLEFILQYVNKDVAETYRQKGDVGYN